MATKINYTPVTYANGTTGNREKVLQRLCESVNALIDNGGGVKLGTTAPAAADGSDGQFFVQYAAGAPPVFVALFVKISGTWVQIV